ncbi:unnamed protein product [Ilex paraguariensis]|uniref:E3 ubiquitin-protein ligase RHF2A n=1 Tax=Ilex paraguariensis TaxID=185542 RepID=A0ABC8UUF2_9AQUA
MCWQSISLKDPNSQELLDAVEHERSIRMNPPRNTTIFHHPTLGDFELQHLPVSATDAELEERIIQHLAAAAAMGRARHMTRREGHRTRSSAQGRPHFLVFSSHPNAPLAPASSSSPTQRGEGEPPSANTGEESPPQITPPASLQADQVSASASGSGVTANEHGTSSSSRRSPTQISPTNQDIAGPSDLQSFSESLKSRISATSTRYKESITKSTRGWKERLFSRNTSMADLGSEVRREVNAGIATVSRIMERLETRDNSRPNTASVSAGSEDSSPPDQGNLQITESGSDNSLNENIQAPCAASSASN